MNAFHPLAQTPGVNAARVSKSIAWGHLYWDAIEALEQIRYGHPFNTKSRIRIMTAFAETAMLVSLNVRAYGARKEDKKISKKVADDNGTDTSAGGYQKNLVPKESLAPITAAISELRTFHYDNTLPWLDEGVRILPSVNYESYKTAMIGLQDKYDSAVRGFVDTWPAIVADAQTRLAGMFNAADYPDDVRARFGCNLRFMPLQDAADFRVDISDMERDMLREQIQGTLDSAASGAMLSLYQRLSDSVKYMAERLRSYHPAAGTEKAKNVFRDTLVDNLRDLVTLIPRLNFTQDPELEAIRLMVERELCASDADTLREDDTARGKVADSADAIAARLGEFMGTTPAQSA